jgi:hypothetical protein
MIKTMKSEGFYVLCYSQKDYEEKNGETEKIGPFKKVENAFDRRQTELITKHWYYVEVVEKVTVTDF